jgi:ABC-2 type transport system permease protein
MVIWTLAKKELRLLLRDRMAAILLLGMPLLFILILGLLVGEGFGQKSDDRLRISLVDEDTGESPFNDENGKKMSWAKVVQRDLAETAGIKVELIGSDAEARELIQFHKRPAILIFKKTFSEKVNNCSFLVDLGAEEGPKAIDKAINPFYRDGVELKKIDAELLKDAKQPAASGIIEQVGQVTMLRVLMPWMISKAFKRLSDEKFIHILGEKVNLPVPPQLQGLLAIMSKGKLKDRISLGEMLELAADNDPKKKKEYNAKVGAGVQEALKEQFRKYDLTGATWAALTKAEEQPGQSGEVLAFQDKDGSGLLNRGAQRYQVLVPSYTVMFAFFLVMNVGWVFVSERRQGTLKRLRAAPITRGQVLLGKLVPYFLLSLAQGGFLLLAGRLVFGMRWGPESWSLLEQIGYLFPVVFTTSLAAMGLALLVAAVARSEIQVALYGAVPVLILALIGGCVLPREMMPEQAQKFSLLTPQGWALDAYRELLDVDANSTPNLTIVARACGVLSVFGMVFIGMAWGLLRLE